MAKQLISRKTLEKKYPTKQQAIDFLNILLIAQVGVDIAERLEGSPFDVKAIKMHLKGFRVAAEKQNAITNELFDIDGRSCQYAYNEAGNLLNGVFKLDPEDWQYIEGLRKLLSNEKDHPKTNRIKKLIIDANS